MQKKLVKILLTFVFPLFSIFVQSIFPVFQKFFGIFSRKDLFLHDIVFLYSCAFFQFLNDFTDIGALHWIALHIYIDSSLLNQL